MSSQIVNSLGSKETQTMIELYETLIESEVARAFNSVRVRISPIAVLENETIDDYVEFLVNN